MARGVRSHSMNIFKLFKLNCNGHVLFLDKHFIAEFSLRNMEKYQSQIKQLLTSTHLYNEI